MGRLTIKAAASFLFFFAILHSYVSPTTAAKRVTSTPAALISQAAMAPTGVDYCAGKCKERCKTVSPETVAEICEGICEQCCAKNNNCVPPGPVGENRNQCKDWSYHEDEGFVYRCP